MEGGFPISVTIVIIVITALISYKGFNDSAFFSKWKHFPYAEHRNRDYLRMLTSGFLHGSWLHLIINMYVLWGFGQTVENEFVHLFGPIGGRVLFAIMYLLTIIAADLPTYMKHKDNPGFSSIGASGAVSGVLFIFILFYPWAGLQFIFLPGVNIPAIVIGVLYLVYSHWASRNSKDIIDHDAHFYGALFGIVFIVCFKPSILLHFAQEIMSIF
jgi:membrane associated rhomboid family serine protease